MQYERYVVESSASALIYEFYSVGPKGRVRKRIEFKVLDWNPDVYNLGFGDVDANGKASDIARTNNGDREKVLATVVWTVLDFLERYPEKSVLIRANSDAKLRLYRMAIGAYLRDWERKFYFLGRVDSEWKIFNRMTNYSSFLMQKKI
jgi:hypothetical protein